MPTMHTLFAGTVRTRSGDPFPGAEVRALVRGGSTPLSVSHVGPEGEFRLRVPTETVPSGRKVTIEAVDRDGARLAVAANLEARPSQTIVCDLRVPDRRARAFKPAADMLPRVSGSLLDPVARTMIEQAIGMAAPPGTPGHNRLIRGINCPAPPIEGLTTLVDDAWEALEGNPVAASRFRQQLQLFSRQDQAPFEELDRMPVAAGAGHFEAPGDLPEAASLRMLGATFSHFASGTARPASILPPRPCALTPVRYLPVAAAALHTAASMGDAARQLAALEGGLCGLGRYSLLLDAAHTTLATGDIARIRGIAGFLGQECGPDDGPIPDLPEPPDPWCPEPPGVPDVDPCLVERQACLRELITQLVPRLFNPSTYTIAAVTPDVACPGDTVVVTGTGFGTADGKVCFTAASGARICVDPVRWSDTEITVVVPDEAGDGVVTLQVLDEVVRVCDHVLPIYRRGNAVPFDGGAARVRSLSANGWRADGCAPPDRDIDIRWSTVEGASVRIRVRRATTVLLDQGGLPAIGTLRFHTPNTTVDQTLHVEATATNRCGTDTRELTLLITEIPTLTIEGMEVTQAIQQFWRPGAVPNSVPTIENKDTIVRVYVSCNRRGFANDRINGVTGTLRVGGTILTPINGITPLNPGGSNPFITARPRAEIDRTRTNHTLNFRIDASLCQGVRTLRARVGVDICQQTVSAERSQNHTWTPNAALKVRYVRIRDDRTGGSGTRPSAASARYTVTRAFDLYPSPPTDIGPAWQATWNTTRAFTTNNGLQQLLNDLDDKHNCSAWEWLWAWTGATECPDDDNAEWVGLTDTRHRGWATGGNTCVSAECLEANGQADLMRIKTSHEVGHNLGFCHDNTGCGGSNPGGACTNKGTLADVGFDPYWNQTVTSAAGVSDIMSYGCTRWVDESTWRTLINNI